MKPGTLPAVTLAALLVAGFAGPAAAQDAKPADGGKAKPAKGGEKSTDLEKEIEAKIAMELDQRVEVKGNRYEIKLRRGSTIVGVLPRGEIWEKQDLYGDYVECKKTDKGSGLRLQYVMGMDGDIFIKREDMKPNEDGDLLKDLGQLSDAQKAKIRDEVIKARRKVIVEREKSMRKELDRLLAARAAKDKGKDGEGGDGASDGEGDDDMTAEEKEGEALLEKFPPPAWNEERIAKIKEREVVNSIYRNKEEAEFIDNFRKWKKALARRMLKEAEEEEDTGGDAK